MIPRLLPKCVAGGIANILVAIVPDDNLVAAPEVSNGGDQEVHKTGVGDDRDDEKCTDDVNFDHPRHRTHGLNIWIEHEQ